MVYSRRRLFARLAFYGSPLAAFGYGAGVEKHYLTLTRADVPVPAKYPQLDGLKVAVMSDFHHDDFGDNRLIRRGVDAINREGVDLVMLGGDYISRDPGALESLCEELVRLESRHGTFAVIGNHDAWHFTSRSPRLLNEAGIELLVNRSVSFGDFAVAGADSLWGGQPDPARALREVGRDTPVLLGWHEPDSFDHYEDPRVVLQVSGHTHGGQVCAPFHGPLVLPKHGRKYPYGLYTKPRRALFVTRGIGTVTLPLRFLCPPEAALLTLRCKSAREDRA